MAIAALTIDLNARIANFESELKRATSTLDRFGKASSTISTGLKAAFAGVGVAGLAAFAKNGIDAADALKDMSDRLGVSVKDLASFKLAAEQSGTELEGVGKGIARLTRSIGEAEGGKAKLGEALKALGISARDPKEAFFQLADATEKIQDPAKRAALLSQVLGKSYQDLIPLLSQGSVELRKSAQGSETFAQAMERLAPDADLLNDNLAKLKENAAGFAATLLGPVAKAMNETIEGFKRIGRLSDAGASFDDFFFGTVNADTGKSLRNINKEIDGVETRIKRAKGFGIFGDTAPLERELTRLKAIRAELHNLSVEQAQAPHKSKSKNVFGDINIPAEKAKGSGSKADPLASLLGQTEIGKMKEFEKNVALLNARFDFGRKSAELYEQAMTKLVETTFAGRFKQAADDQSFMNEVLQDGQDTINESNRRMAEWKETLGEVQTELINLVSPVNVLVKKLTELDKFDGFIDPEVLAAARLEINAQIDDLDKLPKKADDMKEAYKDAFATMTNGLAKFVATGKGDFRSLTKSMLEGLAEVAAKSALLNGLKTAKAATGGSGLLFSILDAIVPSAKGNVFNSPGLSAYSGSIVSRPTVFPFAKGIGLMGEAGAEAILPLKRGKDGKLGVGTSGGGGNVNVSIAIDASGTKVQGDEGKAGQLAREFEGAVLNVITKHQRPGGMLA